MNASTILIRGTTAALLLALLGTGGCSWFHRGGNKLYAADPAQRPLEVPPDLDLARANAGATASGAAAANTQSQPGAGAGFALQGTRDEAFERVGKALDAMPGVVVASRAPLLGAFDVTYQDASFLVRVNEAGSGVQVTVVDPRGQAATGEAPRRLLEALQAAVTPR